MRGYDYFGAITEQVFAHVGVYPLGPGVSLIADVNERLPNRCRPVTSQPGFTPISLFGENSPDETQGLGCDLLRIALDSINTRFLMNKEAYDESNIDPVDRRAGSDRRGLFKH